MKLGWNIAAGFANSVWSAIIWLAAVPFYLRFLGVEAYGLIGFFITMQALFALLDMGLAPTINREVARSSTAEERASARDLLHTLARIYWCVAALIAVATLAAAPLLGRHWLNSAGISLQSVTQAVMLMGLIVAIRFPLGLYLGALMGAQRIVAVSCIEMAMVTVANLGAIVLLARVSATIQAFFLWQVGVGLINVLVVRAVAWRALQGENGERRGRFDGAALRRIWRFSAGMALTAVLGTIFMQSDKVILSKMVSLEDLGRYTLAGLAARSLYVFMTPVFNATYPRLSAQHAAGAIDQIEVLYKSGTRLLMAVVFPVAIFVSVFSVEIFTLWTGDAQLAQSISLVVPLLLLGTALNAAMHFPYALQLACGKSNLPAQINLALLVVFVPLVISLAWKYGILGAAAAWAILNLLYLLLGTWVTHRSLLPRAGLEWIIGDVTLPLVIAVAVTGVGGLAVRSLETNIYSRLLLGSSLAAMSFLLIVAISPNLVCRARRLRVSYL